MHKNKNIASRLLVMKRSTSYTKDEPIKDFLRTPNWVTDILMARELFSQQVWECACGDGKLTKRLKWWGYSVKSTDKYDTGFGTKGIDFLTTNKTRAENAITNPPFKYKLEFINAALNMDGLDKFAFLLPTMTIESKKRRELFEYSPPKKIVHIADRVMFDESEEPGGAFSVSWFIWDKSYKGPTVFEWAWFEGL